MFEALSVIDEEGSRKYEREKQQRFRRGGAREFTEPEEGDEEGKEEVEKEEDENEVKADDAPEVVRSSLSCLTWKRKKKSAANRLKNMSLNRELPPSDSDGEEEEGEKEQEQKSAAPPAASKKAAPAEQQLSRKEMFIDPPPPPS
jgi:hypothetical protein